METSKLVQMANSIGDFFETMPERKEALTGIASHIEKFWEPRMRAQLAPLLAQPVQVSGLKPIVHEALQSHRC